MPFQIIIDAKDGTDAGMQLISFMAILSNNAQPLSRRSETAAAAVDKRAEPVAENQPETAAKPAPEAAKEEPAKAEDKAGEKPADESAKEEGGASKRRRSGSGKKEGEAPATEKAAEPQPAAAAPEFSAPPGFNEKVKASESAAPEVVAAALEKVKQFTPKEGEPATLNYCRALLLYMAAKQGMDHNRKMLDSFELKKIQDLAADRYGDFVLKIKEKLELA